MLQSTAEATKSPARGRGHRNGFSRLTIALQYGIRPGPKKDFVPGGSVVSRKRPVPSMHSTRRVWRLSRRAASRAARSGPHPLRTSTNAPRKRALRISPSGKQGIQAQALTTVEPDVRLFQGSRLVQYWFSLGGENAVLPRFEYQRTPAKSLFYGDATIKEGRAGGANGSPPRLRVEHDCDEEL